MVLHNPNNWHWVDKNCVDWSKQYFSEKLSGLKSEKEGIQAEIAGLEDLQGDVDVSQRKGKVISIFDVKLVLNLVGGEVESDKKAKGTVTIPEVAYDTERDEYVFETNLVGGENSASDAVCDKVKQLVRTDLSEKIRDILQEFGPELIRVHGQDIQHPASEVKSVFTASNQVQGFSSHGSDRSVGSKAKAGTETVVVETTFNTAPEDAFKTLTEEERVQVWGRGKPNEWDAKVGGKYSLFGGNVTGEFKSLKEATEIVQSWKLPGWKSFGQLTITLTPVPGSPETKVVFTLTGIPVGDKEAVEANINSYYIQPIKLSFGYGL
ncbi:hypothetical protein CANCADRAFT_30253 [Tortispora caseinolytica NRRL Y-17796]|uniref:Activator of Hsp90 ATPase AHSA1-like N-terminal domain-containing protein n=1 Tax=Tortispora caseinolytica NRRL Y-17796 TaxID=767744 RepID=A0A1E4TJL3_9ASCO|nr:hypothetical protein CANCADRAFT_30253 [Tortispora caseinolytica NRRL Y-17796]